MYKRQALQRVVLRHA